MGTDAKRARWGLRIGLVAVVGLPLTVLPLLCCWAQGEKDSKVAAAPPGPDGTKAGSTEPAPGPTGLPSKLQLPPPPPQSPAPAPDAPKPEVCPNGLVDKGAPPPPLTGGPISPASAEAEKPAPAPSPPGGEPPAPAAASAAGPPPAPATADDLQKARDEEKRLTTELAEIRKQLRSLESRHEEAKARLVQELEKRYKAVSLEMHNLQQELQVHQAAAGVAFDSGTPAPVTGPYPPPPAPGPNTPPEQKADGDSPATPPRMPPADPPQP